MKAITSILIKNLANQLILKSIPFSISSEICKKSLYTFSTLKQHNSTGKSFNNNAQFIKEHDKNQKDNIQTMPLTNFIQCQNTLKILQKKKIQAFFPIQFQTYNHIYNGKDILASDRTGSGKTIAYSLPIIQKLRNDKVFGSTPYAKFIVFCPTRELVIQVQKQISSLKLHDNDFAITTVYGGSSMERQISFINSGIDIIVATPGRFIDLVQRNAIKLHDVKATCIDEADQMLQKGFKQDIQNIYEKITKQVKKKPQNLMFSATLPDWVSHICRQYLNDDKVRINLIKKEQQKTSMTVKHYAVQCSNNQRLSIIRGLIRTYNPIDRTIIFAETKKEVTQLAYQFQNHQVSFLQGDMSQRERQINLENFRKKKTKILIATDVASRGLDIDNVGLVIQLQPHRTTEPYIHRSGRTGRAGKSGVSITLFNNSNVQNLINIERQTKVKIKVIQKPSNSQEIGQWQKKLSSIQKKLQNNRNKHTKCRQVDQMSEKLLQYYQSKELINSLILQCIGSRPSAKSLITKQSGKSTYILQMKNDQEQNENGQEIDKVSFLNFISQYQKEIGIQNIHSQTSNLIFDIPQQNQQKIQKLKSSLIQKKSSFQIRRALSQDKQMGNLSEYAKKASQGSQRNSYSNQSSRYGQNRRENTSYGERRQFNHENRRQNNNQGRYQQINPSNSTTVFLSKIPYQMSQSELIQTLLQNNIQYSSVKLIKKQTQKGPNAFAFLNFNTGTEAGQVVRKRTIKFNNGEKGFFRISEPKNN